MRLHAQQGDGARGQVQSAGAPGSADAASGPFGSWSATRWLYVSRERPERQLDVVCDLRGTVTLSLSEGAYVLSWDVPERGSASVGGAMTLEGDRLQLRRSGAGAADAVLVRVGADTLALSTSDSAWDFGDGVEEPADFVGILVRL